MLQLRTNVIFKTKFTNNGNNLQIVVCISCTIENVTLTGCGLSCNNLIGRSYLNNMIINLTKSSYIHAEKGVDDSYHDQGIMLRYGYQSLLKRNKLDVVSTKGTVNVTMQNISTYNDDDKSYTYNKGIINVEIEPFQTEDSIEIKVSNSKFDYMTKRIMLYVNSHSSPAKCVIWIINCRFNDFFNKQHNSVIEVKLLIFSVTLIFFKCEFHNNVIRGPVLPRRSRAYHSKTNITFNKCSFKTTLGTVLDLSSTKQLASVSFMNLDLYVNWLGISDMVIQISDMEVYIHCPINISDIHSNKGILWIFTHAWC